VHFKLKTDYYTDTVNMTHAHEKTHKKCYQNTPSTPGPGDLDGDRVPDSWEDDVPGMSSSTIDSFTRRCFSKSPRNSLRDNEFYAYLGGAYVFGSITRNPPTAYKGVKGEKSKKENDWSLNGYNWNK